jgi:Cytochrome C'
MATNSSLFADDTSSNTNKTILNAIHNDEVRNIMRRLKILFYEREYTELELQKLSNKQIKLLAEEAGALGKIAENLHNSPSLKNLSDVEHVTFNAMANQLHDITQELIKENEDNHQNGVDAAFIKLQDTCNTCHQLFRDK